MFDKRQIPKCYDRLDKAKKALYDCRNADNFATFQSRWADFLIHTGSVLHALEAGAAAHPTSKQWYGGEKRRGRSDPLVSYMHQARNAEEHQADPVTAETPSATVVAIDQETKEIIDPTDWGSGRQEDGRHVFDYRPPTRPATVGIRVGRGVPVLRRLLDTRFNSVFAAPREHNGRPLTDFSPMGAGEVYLGYLEALIEKACEQA